MAQKMTTNDQYLWAWKKAGMSDRIIAARLNMDISQVAVRFAQIEKAIADRKDAGVENLINQFNLTCLIYQNLGEGLKEIAAGLTNMATPEEIKNQLKEDPDETVRALMSSFVILRPWKPSDDQKN